MPVIVFASSKGGVGKSSCSVLLACELSRRGAEVVVLDADPNQPIAAWARRAGKPEKLEVISDVTEDTVIDQIDEAAARVPFVIVDLEGTASLTVAYAVSRADLVVIPCQGSQLDAAEAAKAIKLIRKQEKAFNRTIRHAILFTRTSPAIQPRTLRHIRTDFIGHGVPVLETHLHEREAFRAVFSFGGTLDGLKPDQVGGLEPAIRNVQALTSEIVETLRQAQTKEAAA